MPVAKAARIDLANDLVLTAEFEPFQQADWGSGDGNGGLGIGLMLVRRLTELHGGRVEVASAGPGC